MCLIQISSLTQVKLHIICGTYIICPHRDGCLHRSTIHKHTAHKYRQGYRRHRVDSLALAPWHYVTGLWKTSLADPIICTKAFSSATLCIMMFHSLSNRVTIWNILQKCRWDMSDNFQFPLKCTTIYNTCRRSPPCSFHTVSISLMDRLSYSHSVVLLPRYTRLSTPDCFLYFSSFLVTWLFPVSS